MTMALGRWLGFAITALPLAAVFMVLSDAPLASEPNVRLHKLSDGVMTVETEDYFSDDEIVLLPSPLRFCLSATDDYGFSLTFSSAHQFGRRAFVALEGVEDKVPIDFSGRITTNGQVQVIHMDQPLTISQGVAGNRPQCVPKGGATGFAVNEFFDLFVTAPMTGTNPKGIRQIVDDNGLQGAGEVTFSTTITILLEPLL